MLGIQGKYFCLNHATGWTLVGKTFGCQVQSNSLLTAQAAHIAFLKGSLPHCRCYYFYFIIVIFIIIIIIVIILFCCPGLKQLLVVFQGVFVDLKQEESAIHWFFRFLLKSIYVLLLYIFIWDWVKSWQSNDFWSSFIMRDSLEECSLGLTDAISTFIMFVKFNVIQIFTGERYHKSALCFLWGRDSVT